MSENLEIFYNIKAMFTDAMKNPKFNAYLTGTINNFISNCFNITGYNFNYPNRYIEVVIQSDENPMIVVGKLKAILCEFVYSCANIPEIKSILYMTNDDTFTKFFYQIKGNNQIELMKIVNYMYSILFMGNTAQGHLFRIMM